MSTNTRRQTESQTTTTARPTPADAQSADATATETTSDSDTAESWVARCQRQFDPHRTDRLHNLVDEENEALP